MLSKPILGIIIVLAIAGVGLAIVYLSPSETDPVAPSQPRFNTDPIPDTPSQGALHQGESTKSVTIDDPTGLLGMEAEGGLGVIPSSVTTTAESNAGFDFDRYDIGCVNTALDMRATGHPSYWTWGMIFPDLYAGGLRDPTADELTKMKSCIREECTHTQASSVSCEEDTEKKAG